MNIALMRSKITIQKSVITTDSVGNHTATWTDYYTCHAYANIAQTENGGKEYTAAGQTIGSDAFIFTVRYCAALTDIDSTKYRIIFNDHFYNIVKVDDFQFRHETLKLTANRVMR